MASIGDDTILERFKLARTIVLSASATTDKVYELQHNGSGGVGNATSSSPTQNGIVWRRSRKVGKGQYGVVYLEESRTEHGIRSRAVKECKTDHGQTYRNEILNMIRMRDNDHFVSFQNWFEYEHLSKVKLCISMEFLPLGSLEYNFNKRQGVPFAENTVKDIVYEILQGLDALHEAKICHRDLSPKNILVARDRPRWLVKIADFGFAKQQDHFQSILVGTFVFNAPELRLYGRGGLVYDHAIDIWAVGSIGYYLLTYKHFLPYDATLLRYCVGEDPFPQQPLDDHGISTEGRTLLQRLLEPRSKDRRSAKQALRMDWFGEPFQPPRVAIDTQSTDDLETSTRNESTVSSRPFTMASRPPALPPRNSAPSPTAMRHPEYATTSITPRHQSPGDTTPDDSVSQSPSWHEMSIPSSAQPRSTPPLPARTPRPYAITSIVQDESLLTRPISESTETRTRSLSFPTLVFNPRSQTIRFQDFELSQTPMPACSLCDDKHAAARGDLEMLSCDTCDFNGFESTKKRLESKCEVQVSSVSSSSAPHESPRAPGLIISLGGVPMHRKCALANNETDEHHRADHWLRKWRPTFRLDFAEMIKRRSESQEFQEDLFIAFGASLQEKPVVHTTPQNARKLTIPLKTGEGRFKVRIEIEYEHPDKTHLFANLGTRQSLKFAWSKKLACLIARSALLREGEAFEPGEGENPVAWQKNSMDFSLTEAGSAVETLTFDTCHQRGQSRNILCILLAVQLSDVAKKMGDIEPLWWNLKRITIMPLSVVERVATAAQRESIALRDEMTRMQEEMNELKMRQRTSSASVYPNPYIAKLDLPQPSFSPRQSSSNIDDILAGLKRTDYQPRTSSRVPLRKPGGGSGLTATTVNVLNDQLPNRGSYSSNAQNFNGMLDRYNQLQQETMLANMAMQKGQAFYNPLESMSKNKAAK